MLVKKLKINNFEAHKESILEFSPYFNVIRGSSESGKSSIIRALRILFFNDLKGQKNVLTNEKSYVINALLSDNAGKEVFLEREKGDTVNAYRIKDENGESNYDKIGINTPSEITNRIPIKKIVLDEDNEINVNFFYQGDPWFIVSASDVIKGQFFGKFANLHVLDNMIKKWNSNIKELGSKRNLLTEEKEAKEIKLKSLKETTAMEELLHQSEAVLIKIHDKKDMLKFLEAKQEELNAIGLKSRKVKTVLDLFSKVDVDKIIDRINKLEIVQEKSIYIQEAVDKVKKLKVHVDELKLDLAEATQKYTDILNKLDVCPTCGSDKSQMDIGKIL